MMAYNILFSSNSVISGQLKVIVISLPTVFDPWYAWSELGSANHSPSRHIFTVNGHNYERYILFEQMATNSTHKLVHELKTYVLYTVLGQIGLSKQCCLSSLSSLQSLNLGTRWGTRWRCKNTFPPFPVFRCPQGISKLHSCPFLDVIFPSLLSSSLYCSFHCPLQNCLRHATGSWDVAILSFRFFTMVRRSSCTRCILDSVRHMVLVGNVQKPPIAFHLKGLDPSLEFCCQGPALMGIKEGGWVSASA